VELKAKEERMKGEHEGRMEEREKNGKIKE
jgi:hypothetical protein